MKLTEIQNGFFTAFRASGNSKSTVELYRYALGQLTNYLDDPEIDQISLSDLEEYFVYLQDEYVPNRKNGDKKPLSGSTLQNHWKAIRSFFNYCIHPERTLIKKNPAQGLKCPPENPEAIIPMTKQEVEALLNSSIYACTSKPSNRKAFTMHRRTWRRDVAMILVLLDTGMRVGELSRLRLCDYDQNEQCLLIKPYGNSQMKTKSRPVYISDRTATALFDYLSPRDCRNQQAPLFLGEQGNSVTPNSIRLLVADLSKKAGIRHIHPHIFRHTYSIQFLRNGGNIYDLQKVLGHADLKMCMRYLAISRTDVANAQKIHSPVSCWNLGAKSSSKSNPNHTTLLASN